MKNPNMIRRLAAVSAVALSLATFAPVGVSLASAAGCSFSGGFATLDAMIPNTVGGCLGNPSTLSNGNTVQQTTVGLMAFNPADSVPEFTDGNTTWVLGPDGLQSRPNDQRFDYETPASQVAGVFITNEPVSSMVGCVTTLINTEGISHPVTGVFPLPTDTSC
jgi:hypothetical protein